MKLKFVIAGFQKCASTWLHRCMDAHPEISLPKQHMIHFFDIHYRKGPEWLESFFPNAPSDRILGESTVTYARSVQAMQRISTHSSDAQIILILRDPVERAWSHYWHERKKEKITFEFGEWKHNYDLFTNWIAPGLYENALEVCDQLFGGDRVLVLFHDDILARPQLVLKAAYRFVGADPEFVPPIFDERINRTVVKQSRARTLAAQLLGGGKSEQDEFELGMPTALREELIQFYRPTVEYLETRFGRDLSHWLTRSELRHVE